MRWPTGFAIFGPCVGTGGGGGLTISMVCGFGTKSAMFVLTRIVPGGAGRLSPMLITSVEMSSPVPDATHCQFCLVRATMMDSGSRPPVSISGSTMAPDANNCRARPFLSARLNSVNFSFGAPALPL